MDTRSIDNRRNFLRGAATSVLTAAMPAAAEVPSRPLTPEHLYSNSLDSTSLTGEAADRLILKRLVDSWAHCADRRLAAKQVSYFTPDGVLNNYAGDPATHKPDTLRGRAEIQKALAVLNTFTATFHINGQSNFSIQGSRAIGESYCMAHQLFTKDDQRTLQAFYIRYNDNFVRIGREWFFAERNLVIEIADTHPSHA